jgi:hypothetical protein
MGQASIPVEMIIGGKTFDKWLRLEDQIGKVGQEHDTGSSSNRSSSCKIEVVAAAAVAVVRHENCMCR